MFLAFTKEKFKRRNPTINEFIRFYNIFDNYYNIVTYNATYREIKKNLPEIKEMLG